MNIVRFDPFNSFCGVNKGLSRFFKEWEDESPRVSSNWRPSVDIFEDDDKLVLSVEVPGVDKKDIKINVENNVLSISGERKFEQEEKKDNFRRIERRFGSFYRSFTLPRAVDTEKIEATTKNGVLEITLPKREEAKPRQIEVSVN